MRHVIRDLKWQIGMLSKDQSRRKIVLLEGLNRVERPAIRGHTVNRRKGMLSEVLNRREGTVCY